MKKSNMLNAKTAALAAALMIAAGSAAAAPQPAEPTTIDNEIEMLRARLDAQEKMFNDFIRHGFHNGYRHHPRAFFDDPYFFPDDALFALPAPVDNNAFGKMNVADRKDMIEVTVELPGMEKDDISIEVKDNMLSIAGEKKGETEVKDGDYYMQERSFGTFNRSLALPDNIEINKITSSLKNGVLTINIPKTEAKEVKTVKIPVK